MKRYQLFLTTLLCCFILVGITTNISAQNQGIKRVLLEQHTGAWCGWCVDGTVKMDELLQLYPETFIGVKFHNGDKMAITEQGEIGTAMGLTGYPTGSVDRRSFGGAIFIDRGSWKAAVQQVLAEPAKCDVSLVYSINTETLELVATVTAKFYQDVNDDLMFNVYVVENNLTGTGTGWDQANYYSGNASYPNHPYYSKPNPIVGYVHERTVRKPLGGSFGALGEIPNPAKAGEEYSHSFVYQLDPTWKLEDLMFIGIVQANSAKSKEILNCCYGVEGTPKKPVVQVAMNAPYFGVRANGTAFPKRATITNISEESRTYAISAVLSSRTPSDWTATTEFEEVTVEPNESKEVLISLTPGSTLGYGDAKLMVSDKNNPSELKGVSLFTAVSAEIEKFEVINPMASGSYAITPILKNAGYNDLFDITPENISNFMMSFPNLKLMIWNTGASASLIARDANAIKAAMYAGVGTFVCGNLAVSGLNTNYALTDFGVTYKWVSREGYGSAPFRIYLNGVEGDPISGDFGTNIEGNLISYLLPVIYPSSSEASSIISFSKHADSVLAVKVQKENSRAALYCFTPYVIVDQQKRNNLVKKTVDWILGANSVEENGYFSEGAFTMNAAPNPVSIESRITVNFDGTNSVEGKLSLYNVMGQEVAILHNGRILPGDNLFDLNSDLLPSGSYRLVLSSNKTRLTMPISIVK